MKLKARKIVASALAMATMVTSMGSISANAMTSSTAETAIVSMDDNMVAPCSYTVGLSYDCDADEVDNVGKFKATSSRVYLTFNEPNDGKVDIKFHTGSYGGPVYKTITPPAAGTTSTTLYTDFAVTSGTTYYITAEPADGYIHTSGGFTITY